MPYFPTAQGGEKLCVNCWLRWMYLMNCIVQRDVVGSGRCNFRLGINCYSRELVARN